MENTPWEAIDGTRATGQNVSPIARAPGSDSKTVRGSLREHPATAAIPAAVRCNPLP
jgi:hypothetical protein